MRNIEVNRTRPSKRSRPGMAGLARVRLQQGGGGARPRNCSAQLELHARPPGITASHTPGQHALRQHDPALDSSPVPRRPRVERRIKSLIRWNAMAMVVRANRDSRRHRRPHLDLRLGGHAVRSRLQPLLPRHGRAATPATRSTSRATPSPGIYARAFLEGRLTEEQLRELPPRAAAGRRAVVVSASVADARLLGIPHGVDGPRADHGHLPGALQPLPRATAASSDTPSSKVWAFLGDGEMRRAGDARRDHARRRARSSTT